MEPDDILLWSERQAELLRRRAVDDLDFDNLAEEIADLGKRAAGLRVASYASVAPLFEDAGLASVPRRADLARGRHRLLPPSARIFYALDAAADRCCVAVRGCTGRDALGD